MNEPGAGPGRPFLTPDAVVWHRVHPVTPLVRGWAVVAALLVVIGQQSLDDIPTAGDWMARLWWQALAGLVVVALVAFGYAALAWRMTAYAVDDESVRLHTGVLFRQQRKARLDRLQAVDLVQPLVARMFGLAELKIEIAGGAGSSIRLGFLKLDEAERLRKELLARAAGIRLGASGGVRAPGQVAPGSVVPGAGAPGVVAPGSVVPGPVVAGVAGPQPGTVGPELVAGPGAAGTSAPPPGALATADAFALEAPEAPERPLTEVPVGRLVGSILASGASVAAVIGIAAFVGAVIGSREIGAIMAALPVLFIFGGFVVSRFTGEYGFRSAISPDGIRLRHGLLETRSQTIPPGRVQALRLSQSVLWRRQGWWRVDVNVAGYVADADQSSNNTNLLLPVGSREDALVAVWLVLPDLGTPDPRGLLVEALAGIGPGEFFTVPPRRARWLDPFVWRRTGVAVTDRALVIRRGRLLRRVLIVPHERTQSLGVQQGPWQRRLRVATFAVHSTPGPVLPVVPHLAEDDAARLLDEQSTRAREARAQAGPELWMRRDEVPS